MADLITENEAREVLAEQTPPPVPLDVVTMNLDRAEAIAGAVQSFCTRTGQLIPMGGRDYVQIGGWQFLVAQLGFTFVEVEVERFWDEVVSKKPNDPTGYGYRATVEIRNGSGAVISRGSNICTSSEPWAVRKDKRGNAKPEHAIRSMAITRASGRAARLGFGWLMELAGYAATPAEELDPDEKPGKRSRKKSQTAEPEPVPDPAPVPESQAVDVEDRPAEPAAINTAKAALFAILNQDKQACLRVWQDLTTEPVTVGQLAKIDEYVASQQPPENLPGF